MVGFPSWDNYSLIFTERRDGELRGIPLVDAGEGKGLNLGVLEREIREALRKGGPLRLLLNFPNNPSGYSPRTAEADALIALIRKTAEEGTDVMVICDDAYFGLFYEEDIARESLFASLADLHERVLAVKIDGPTKEDYVWGFRVAFITFASRGLKKEHYDALEKKLLGAIRSSVSCSNMAAQYLTIKALSDPRTGEEKARHFRTLRDRYRAVRRFITENPDHPRLKPLPFNSGYFMCFRCTGIDAEVLRRELLAKHGIGVIALGPDYLRVSYAGLDEEDIPGVYRAIYDTALP
jgi:aspartate/methionine/tyrosine aminotransferase